MLRVRAKSERCKNNNNKNQYLGFKNTSDRNKWVKVRQLCDWQPCRKVEYFTAWCEPAHSSQWHPIPSRFLLLVSTVTKVLFSCWIERREMQAWNYIKKGKLVCSRIGRNNNGNKGFRCHQQGMINSELSVKTHTHTQKHAHTLIPATLVSQQTFFSSPSSLIILLSVSPSASYRPVFSDLRPTRPDKVIQGLAQAVFQYKHTIRPKVCVMSMSVRIELSLPFHHSFSFLLFSSSRRGLKKGFRDILEYPRIM